MAQEATYRSAFRDQFLRGVEARDDRRLDGLWGTLIARKAIETREDIEAVLRKALAADKERALNVVARLPQNDATWNALARVGGVLEHEYWASLRHLFEVRVVHVCESCLQFALL